MYWFVYVHVGDRGQHGVCSSNAFHSSRSSQQGVLLNLVLADLIKIPSQSVPGILSPPPDHWDCSLGFYAIAEDPNSSFHVYMSSILCTGPYPKLNFIFRLIGYEYLRLFENQIHSFFFSFS